MRNCVNELVLQSKCILFTGTNDDLNKVESVGGDTGESMASVANLLTTIFSNGVPTVSYVTGFSVFENLI